MQSVRFALFGTLPTKSHQKAWQSFEKILVYRSNVFLIQVFLVLCLKYLTGDTVFDLYEKQVREGKPHNKEFADATLPYIKVTESIFLVTLPVLLLLNLLSDKVCRLYPLVFAIRLSGFFLVAIDYGTEVR